jgi:hypothetical protein
MTLAFLSLPRQATLTKALGGCSMTRPRTSVTGVALGLTILTGACDRQNDRASVLSSPTTPLPANNPSPAAPRGEITIRSLTPSSPATIPVSECEYAPTYNEICTKEFLMVFEVQFAEQVPAAMIEVDLYRAGTRCGYGGSAQQPLTAGGRATFSVSRLSLEKDGGPLLCPPLPVETTRMVVRLLDIGTRPARDSLLMTQEFVNTYTFAKP